MPTTAPAQPVTRLTLDPLTAAELMTPNPVSLRRSATVEEATTLLTRKGFSAAPVIDDAGHPVGVLSRTDLLIHDGEKISRTPRSDSTPTPVDTSTAGDLMTPVVFSVTPHATAAQVIEQMIALKVHRLFVVDPAGVLVGVISALDILRHLRA